ncbi:Acetyltransferases [Variovorax sp. HW608]|nr:Acetyltransferases [Variovorax sp. HW608]
MIREDWAWISEWFRDPVLDRELGPLDGEWLEYVLARTEGVELVLRGADGRPAALLGCVWDSAGVEHGITDIAVDPARRGQGLGRLAVEAALAWPEHPPAERWIAFVDPENRAAFGFFTALGWDHEGCDALMERFAWSPARGARIGSV